MQIQHRQPILSHVIDNSLPPLLDRLYRNRGITDVAQIQTQLKELHHYNTMKGIDLAVKVVADAMEINKRICIIGDFDADGATSTALCILAMRDFGFSNISYLVPNRFDFGYGLSPEIVDVAKQEKAELLITVDNGISCIAGVEHAKSLGMQVVVTDHHLPGATLPQADAIVNPNQADCAFLSKNLAGVGVAFYLMLALKTELEKRHWFASKELAKPNLAKYLDIVALGTVADVVPLDNNNRVLVHQGLQRIRSGVARPGIKAILDVASRPCHKLSSTDLGFVIGPRLNAAGRLDDMALGIECLLCEDPQQARQMAARLDALNLERREIESSMQEEAIKALDSVAFSKGDIPSGVVLYKDDYHQGVIGILAGRIKEKYFRPTIVFAEQDDNSVKGSARSIPGVHIRDILEYISSQHPGLIAKFGGHAMAAGLSLEKNKLATFKKAFEEAVLEATKGLGSEPILLSDGSLPSHEINVENASLLKLAVPWGQTFEEPLFDGVFMLKTQRIVGKKHLKMIVAQGGVEFDAIAFNIDTQQWPNKQIREVELAYKLDINEFRGQISVQLLVQDLTPYNTGT
ncbi:single-stranded-DNA-specific exonuclease RecJ [Glaciecola sp. MH2013]|uniref:single-stranded-DNA-specific exonuclease RecJ n=1 Tax=Glaciecola sp. MH2013 TaxID=2785524 RepID=UPI00189F7055|nr:single-stranded-DNA-specific exonuclease RecJ [Glaciecola sp. MH2013]MBF7075065.1 single-stranded-DNA-specific exonuclease RecJ [Glaciecola sp. MH2013]